MHTYTISNLLALKFEILCPTVFILVFYISWAWSILFCSSPFWTCQIFIWSSFNKDMMFSSSFQISLTISLKLTVNYSQLCFRWCVFFYKNAPTETQFAAVNVSTVDSTYVEKFVSIIMKMVCFKWDFFLLKSFFSGYY